MVYLMPKPFFWKNSSCTKLKVNVIGRLDIKFVDDNDGVSHYTMETQVIPVVIKKNKQKYPNC